MIEISESGVFDSAIEIQIIEMRKVVEKILEKRKKLYAAFMDLEKAYDRVDWLALWEVLRIYGLAGKLLSAIKFLVSKTSAIRVIYLECIVFQI